MRDKRAYYHLLHSGGLSKDKMIYLYLGPNMLRAGAKVYWDFRISDLVKKTLMVNFGEVRRPQLAKSTILTSSLVSLGSFQIF